MIGVKTNTLMPGACAALVACLLVFAVVSASDQQVAQTGSAKTAAASSAALTAEKVRQVRKVAEGYLARRGIRNQACRFDVVAIRFSGVRGSLNHIRDAF